MLRTHNLTLFAFLLKPIPSTAGSRLYSRDSSSAGVFVKKRLIICVICVYHGLCCISSSGLFFRITPFSFVRFIDVRCTLSKQFICIYIYIYTPLRKTKIRSLKDYQFIPIQLRVLTCINNSKFNRTSSDPNGYNEYRQNGGVLGTGGKGVKGGG